MESKAVNFLSIPEEVRDLIYDSIFSICAIDITSSENANQLRLHPFKLVCAPGASDAGMKLCVADRLLRNSCKRVDDLGGLIRLQRTERRNDKVQADTHFEVPNGFSRESPAEDSTVPSILAITRVSKNIRAPSLQRLWKRATTLVFRGSASDLLSNCEVPLTTLRNIKTIEIRYDPGEARSSLHPALFPRLKTVVIEPKDQLPNLQRRDLFNSLDEAKSELAPHIDRWLVGLKLLYIHRGIMDTFAPLNTWGAPPTSSYDVVIRCWWRDRLGGNHVGGDCYHYHRQDEYYDDRATMQQAFDYLARISSRYNGQWSDGIHHSIPWRALDFPLSEVQVQRSW